MIRSEFQWIVDLPIPCPECNKETPDTVARLVKLDTLPCRGCGHNIDLSDHRVMIQEFADLCGKYGRKPGEDH